MGPWFIRDESNPFRPGCSIETLRRLAARGRIGPDTIIRGPTTRQFWMFARNTPGVGNLFGECHSCHQRVKESDSACPACSADFSVPDDRQTLGLGPIHLLPGHAPPETIAATADEPARGKRGTSGGGKALLGLGIAGALFGVAALGGTLAAGWTLVEPALAGAAKPSRAAPPPSPAETGDDESTVVAASTKVEKAEPAADAGESSASASALRAFEGRWREHLRLSEGL